MKQVRLALYFVLGIFLGAYAVLSHAETVTADLSPVGTLSGPISTKYYRGGTAGTPLYDSFTSTCEAVRSIAGYSLGSCSDVPVNPVPIATSAWNAGTCKFNNGGTCNYAGSATVISTCPSFYTMSYPGGVPTCLNSVAVSTCQPNQNWTLSGSNCTRPDCVAPQTMQSDGTCKAPACPSGQHPDPSDPAKCQPDCIGDQIQQSDGTCKCALTGSKTVSYVVPPGGVGSYASDCLNNCKQSISSSGFCPSGVVTAFTGGSTTCYTRATPTGATCNSVTGVPMPPLEVKVAPPPAPSDTTGTAKDNVTPDSKNTPDNNKDPVSCGAAGGSYGTYNGVSKCLTPSANDQVAKVSDISGTVTNPDGSTVKTLKQVIQIQGGPDSPGLTETITTKQTCTAAGVCTSSSTSSTVQSPSTTSSGNGSASNGWTGSGSSSGTGTGHQY